MSSKLQLKVPRAQEFAQARSEALEKQLAEKLEKKEMDRQIRVNEQQVLIEEAFDTTPVSQGYVKVTLPGFKTLFEEEIETTLHNAGYCVDYSVQDDAPAQTTAWISPQMTEADYDAIHNEVYRLETEIRELIAQALQARMPKPAPRPLPNLDVIRQLIQQLQKYSEDDDEDDCDCDCDCECNYDSSDSEDDESDDDCEGCYEELYGKSDSESDDESDDADAHVELCNECREELYSDLCDDCGRPRAPTPDLCDDCGKPQLL